MAAVSSYNAKKPEPTILLQYHDPSRPPRPNSPDPAQMHFTSAAELFAFLKNAPRVTKTQGTSVAVYGLKQVDLQALLLAVSTHQKLETITLAEATDVSLPSVLTIPPAFEDLNLMHCTQTVYKSIMELVRKHWWRKELRIGEKHLCWDHRFEFNSKYENRFPAVALNQANAPEVPFPAGWFD